MSHSYLFKVLEKFGFGENFVNWMRIFYKNMSSSVKYDGNLTKFFPIRNSVIQEYPISAMLYVIAAEPLGGMIFKSPFVSGIKVPGTDYESKVFQHADDTTLTLCNKQSVCVRVFDMFIVKGPVPRLIRKNQRHYVLEKVIFQNKSWTR